MKKLFIMVFTVIVFMFVATACGGSENYGEPSQTEPMPSSASQNIDEKTTTPTPPAEIIVDNGVTDEPFELHFDLWVEIFGVRVELGVTPLNAILDYFELARAVHDINNIFTPGRQSNSLLLNATVADASGTQLMHRVTNLTDNDLTHGDSTVTHIGIRQDSWRDAPGLILPHGFVFGETTRDDIIAALGETTSEGGSGDFFEITHRAPFRSEPRAMMRLTLNGGVLTAFDIFYDN